MEQKEQHQDVVKELFARAVDRGEIRQVDSELAARMTMGLIFSVFGAMIFLEGITPDEDTVEEMLDIFKNGFIHTPENSSEK